jgi:hypothetical protein
MGWTVRLLYDDPVSKSPDFEMDLLNFLDLRRGTLKGGKGGSLSMNRCHKGTKAQRIHLLYKPFCVTLCLCVLVAIFTVENEN